jgi:hypothetical protein
MPVILATWEAEIKRIAVQGQPRQIVYETLAQKYLTQKRAGRVVQVPSKHEALSANPTSAQKRKRKREREREKEGRKEGKKEGKKNKKSKLGADGVAQAVEGLASRKL